MREVVALSSPDYRSKTDIAYAPFKRFLDIAVSFLMLVLLTPVMLIVAIVVAIDTKGSPIFVQDRMGRYSVPFKIYKFRSMSTQAPANVATHKLENAEKYISRIGKFIRKTSLDELPQLFNVLKGDMSFVGPRPVVLTERDLLRLRRRNGADRVRPGITGLAQVSGRDTVTIRDKARFDAQYAKSCSLKGDLSILFKTVKQVVVSEGIVEGANKDITASTNKISRSA